MSVRNYFSHAKLILLGEYAVLQGIDAICLPLSTGQNLIVNDVDSYEIQWVWTYKDHIIADIVFEPKTLKTLSGNPENAIWCRGLLELIRLYNPGFLLDKGCRLSFVNHFPEAWGLGSSSATISSLCRMAGVNPYLVNKRLMGGSGADIACTTRNNWFLYRMKLPEPEIWNIPVDYRFIKNSYFIYSGSKQATAEHLRTIASQNEAREVQWSVINSLVYRFLAATKLKDACDTLDEHEAFISNAIKRKTIGDEFSDFPGKIKSLGAWGGDFFMALTTEKPEFVKKYFGIKGFDTVFSWHELVNSDNF